MKNTNSGTILIESVFVIPMVLLLILGFCEINRIRTAQRILDSISLNIANEMATSTPSSDHIKKIVESNLVSGNLAIVSNLKNYSSKLKYYVDVYNTNYKYSTYPAVTFNRIDGQILYANPRESSIKRGATIIVTCVYKFSFLCAFTQLAFTGKRKKDTNGYILLHSRSISKRF